MRRNAYQTQNLDWIGTKSQLILKWLLSIIIEKTKESTFANNAFNFQIKVHIFWEGHKIQNIWTLREKKKV